MVKLEVVANRVSLRERRSSAVVSNRTRRTFRGWMGGLLIMGTSVVGAFLPKLLTGEQSLFSMTSLMVLVAGIILTFLYARWQTRSDEESPEAIKEQVSQLQ